ncbi:MAG: ZIP family metal transporter [Polyangiaceae bacterium]|jgi:zinc transporter ZupT
MTALLLAVVTFFSTALGGLFALHRRRHLYLVMGAAAGLLIGSALLDLLPDALGLVRDRGRAGVTVIALAALAGFLVFLALDHAVHYAAAGHQEHGARAFGTVAALGLTVHSFFDGLAIGAAFEQSAALGALIGIAVIAHDFGDGVSTVGVLLGSRATVRASVAWLAADAAAPVVGALAARALHLPRALLADLLGFFAGTFLFVGAAHLLPEAAHEGRKLPLAVTVAGGIAFIGVATWLVQR